MKARLTDTGPLVFTVVLVTIVKGCKQPTHPTVGERMHKVRYSHTVDLVSLNGAI